MIIFIETQIEEDEHEDSLWRREDDEDDFEPFESMEDYWQHEFEKTL